jgi:catechol 2,3-dioxygenase-like lactoylglutathione lyase family enzyme
VSVRGLHHVQLAMPAGEEDRARAFYGDLLGIPEREKPPHLAVRGGCWFETDSVRIHLGVEADFRPAAKAHPGLLVDALDDLADTLRRAGYPPEPDQPLPGYHRLYVSDPFGNRIELLEELHDLE